MRIAVCNELFQGLPIEEAVASASRFGYDGIEIAPFTLSASVEDIGEAERRRTRQAAQGRGVDIVGTHWLLVSPAGLSVSSPDEAVRRRTAGYLASLADFTADIGGRIMVFGSPKQRSIHAGSNRAQTEERLAEALLPCLHRAAERSVTVCLEPLRREETDMLNTAAETADFIRRVNHPNLRLILDVRAMSDEATPIPDIIRKSAGMLAHVHVNDPNGSHPGSGQVEYGPIIAALKDIDYQGWLSVEVFDFSPGHEAIAGNSIAYLRRFL